MDGDVAGARRERNVGKVEVGLADSRPHERAVRAREHVELTRYLVGAGHRDADGESATVVGVATDPAVLVPWDVGDASVTADRLEERFDAVVRALGAEAMAGARDRRKVEEAVIADNARAPSDSRSKPCIARPTITVGGARPPRRPSPSRYVGAARSMSAEIASISRDRRDRRCVGSRPSRGSGASRTVVVGPERAIELQGRPSRSSRVTDPGV